MTKTRRLSLAALLTCCLGLQSCFTAAVLEGCRRPKQAVALVPFTLMLDLVTLPLQIEYFSRDGSCH